MSQLHINVPDDIKIQAQNELKKRGQTLTSEIRSVLYHLARIHTLYAKISSVPKENKPLSKKAKKDLSDDSTVSTKKKARE